MESTPIMHSVEEFLTYQLERGRYVQNSASAVRSDFRGLLRSYAKLGVPGTLGAFTLRNIERHFTILRKAKLAGNTLSRNWKSLNAFAQWAVPRGYLSVNPLASVDLGFLIKRRRNFLFDHEQTRRFLWIPVRTTLPAATDRLIRCLLVFAGLRSSEVINLKWRHVDLERLELNIYDTKGSRRKGLKDNLDRVIPICQPLGEALRAIVPLTSNLDHSVVASRRGKRLTRETYYQLFGSIKLAMGIPNETEFVPHCLRHSLSGNLNVLGTSGADLAMLLGHQNGSGPDQRPTTTDRYVTGSHSRLRSFLERYAEIVMAAQSPATTTMTTLSPPLAEHVVPMRVPAHTQGLNWSSGRTPGPAAAQLPIRAPVATPPEPPPAIPVDRLAQYVALWTKLYPAASVNGPEFLSFLQSITTQGVA